MTIHFQTPPITNLYLNNTLQDIPSYAGCFSQDNAPFHNILSECFHFKKFGRGIYARSVIMNLSPAHERGTHFVSILFFTCSKPEETKIIVRLYDPLTLAPPQNMLSYFDEHTKKLLYRHRHWLQLEAGVTQPLQHNVSVFCGYYCMLRVLKTEYALRQTRSQPDSCPYFTMLLKYTENEIQSSTIKTNDLRVLQLISKYWKRLVTSPPTHIPTTTITTTT